VLSSFTRTFSSLAVLASNDLIQYSVASDMALTGTPTGADTWRMEQFSRAYIQAIAAGAECSASVPAVDIDSLDVSLRRKTTGTSVRSPQLDVQVKATFTDCVRDSVVAYPLSVKNYEELRGEDILVPRILVVVVIPDDIATWMEHSEDSLALRRCAYWYSLRTHAATTNTGNVTLHIPRSQIFDVGSLDAIFQRLEAGAFP
jgi:hypothetical protein